VDSGGMSITTCPTLPIGVPLATSGVRHEH
jgi:hypothetical protein